MLAVVAYRMGLDGIDAVIRYLDDFLFVEGSERAGHASLAAAMHISDKLGPVNPDKTEGPAQRITFLASCSTPPRRQWCTPERVAELTALLHQFVAGPSTHRLPVRQQHHRRLRHAAAYTRPPLQEVRHRLGARREGPDLLTAVYADSHKFTTVPLFLSVVAQYGRERWGKDYCLPRCQSFTAALTGMRHYYGPSTVSSPMAALTLADLRAIVSVLGTGDYEFARDRCAFTFDFFALHQRVRQWRPAAAPCPAHQRRQISLS